MTLIPGIYFPTNHQEPSKSSPASDQSTGANPGIPGASAFKRLMWL